MVDGDGLLSSQGGPAPCASDTHCTSRRPYNAHDCGPALRLSWYPMGGVRIYQPRLSLAKAFENCILLSLSAEGAVLLLTIVEEDAVGASQSRPVPGALGVRVRYDTRAYAELAARKARVTDMRD